MRSIEHAADATGQAGIPEEAEEVFERPMRTELTVNDGRRFLEILEGVVEPNARMLAAAAHFKDWERP